MATKQRLELTWYNKDRALIPTEVGKYGYTWVHPSDPRYCETRPLVMYDYVEGIQSPKDDAFQYSERADFTPSTDNLLIQGESGDVLEALTRVPELASKYVGQVKLIYIDPPFNTEQTFEHYEDNLEHSIWLTMMRDRLLHMKRLLRQDGSIWVHLDDAESHRMHLLLDEVFGAENFVAEIIWGKADTSRNDAKQFSTDQDYILVYSRNPGWRPNRLSRKAVQDAIYSNPDGDIRPWLAKPGHAPGAATHAGMVYAIQSPLTGELLYPPAGGCWRLGEARMFSALSGWANYRMKLIGDKDVRAKICGLPESQMDDIPAMLIDGDLPSVPLWKGTPGSPMPEVFFINGGSLLQVKGYLPDGTVPRTLWDFRSVGSNRNSKSESKALFGGTSFATPKPERLMERILHLASAPGDVVLDVFAGSGTTAAVAHKMARRWVTCELLQGTFEGFTRRRLEKVAHGQDSGGITTAAGERVPSGDIELPDGITPDEAAKFNSVLNKLLAEDPELKKSPVVKQLKASTKTTRTKTVVNWRGGGGFQVAHLAPACFDYDADLDRVILTEAATGETLINSVAANLGFARLSTDEDLVFDGKRGRTFLKVNEGVLDTAQTDEWLAQLEEGQKLLIATTGLVDGVREHLRRHGHGSQVKHIPDDLFRYSQENDQ